MILSHSCMFAAVRDSVGIYQRDQTVFFVSPNATVHGAVYIVDADANILSKNIPVKRRHKAKPVTADIPAQMKAKKLQERKVYEHLQKQISSRIKHSYLPSSLPQLNRSQKNGSEALVISANNIVVFFAHQQLFSALNIQTVKQKFDNSLSYLHFSRLLDSFLRGPPAFS